MWYLLDLNLNLQEKSFVSGFYTFSKTGNFSEFSFPIYTMGVGRGKLSMLRSLHLLCSKLIQKDGHWYWSELRQRNHSAKKNSSSVQSLL